VGLNSLKSLNLTNVYPNKKKKKKKKKKNNNNNKVNSKPLELRSRVKTGNGRYTGVPVTNHIASLVLWFAPTARHYTILSVCLGLAVAD
jgi:hypothetical protein